MKITLQIQQTHHPVEERWLYTKYVCDGPMPWGIVSKCHLNTSTFFRTVPSPA